MTITKFKSWYPGVLVCVLIGIAAMALGNQYGMPAMLIAILLGLALHSLATNDTIETGIDWCAKPMLYWAVALLGLRIDLAVFTGSGTWLTGIAIILLAATIIAGYFIGRLICGDRSFSILMSSAVAICGVSAAAAVSCVLPKNKSSEGQLALTIGGITVLSTVAMILYPAIAQFLNLSETRAGIFIGGTIHNVSQAVGAGYAVSTDAGDMATLIKLIRVSLLLPTILLISLLFSNKSDAGKLSWKTYFPPFLIAFFVLALFRYAGWVPTIIMDLGNQLSEAFLIISLVAIGIKTEMAQILGIGPRPLWVLTITTVFMAALAILVLACVPASMF